MIYRGVLGGEWAFFRRRVHSRSLSLHFTAAAH